MKTHNNNEKVIAAILPEASEYADRILEGMVRYVESHWNLQIVEIPYLRERAEDLVIEEEFDAAVIWADKQDKWVYPLIEQNIPLINLSSDLYDLGVATMAYSSPLLYHAAIEHLMQFGCKEILYASRDIEAVPEKQLLTRRFLDEAEKAGISSGYISISEQTEVGFARQLRLNAAEERHVRDSLEKLNFPAGMHCVDDYIGMYIARIAQEMGILVPEQLALTGEPDYRVARCCRPRLSSFPLGHGVSYQAMRILDHHLAEGAEIPLQSPMPPPPIIWRESSGGGEASTGYLQRARQLIHELACSGVTVGEVAKEAGATPKTLNQKYRTAFGITPGQAIRKERTSYAKHYLAETNNSISEVAGLCGYSSQSKFSNFFKRETGITPMQYRKQYQSLPDTKK